MSGTVLYEIITVKFHYHKMLYQVDTKIVHQGPNKSENGSASKFLDQQCHDEGDKYLNVLLLEMRVGSQMLIQK